MTGDLYGGWEGPGSPEFPPFDSVSLHLTGSGPVRRSVTSPTGLGLSLTPTRSPSPSPSSQLRFLPV